jgi:2-oxoglutarate dehydrogenase complex dehydrogenase (E1) component-like enzyme
MDVVNQLEKLYCSSTGIEFMHVESLEEREWLVKEYEAMDSQEVDSVTKKEIAEAMIVSQNFDIFVGAKFPTVKRYGGEGAESCIPFYREIFKLASAYDAHHVFMCMAHRGKFEWEYFLVSQSSYPVLLI